MTEPPRLLHRQFGYTTNPAQAMRGEPEALTAEQVDDLNVKAARVARDRQADEWRERRARLDRELDWLISQRRERDVTTQVRAVRRQLDRIDQRLARPPTRD